MKIVIQLKNSHNIVINLWEVIFRSFFIQYLYSLRL